MYIYIYSAPLEAVELFSTTSLLRSLKGVTNANSRIFLPSLKGVTISNFWIFLSVKLHIKRLYIYRWIYLFYIQRIVFQRSGTQCSGNLSVSWPLKIFETRFPERQRNSLKHQKHSTRSGYIEVGPTTVFGFLEQCGTYLHEFAFIFLRFLAGCATNNVKVLHYVALGLKRHNSHLLTS